MPDLNGRALFNAEFCIGHDDTLPEGQVLHSVFATAQLISSLGTGINLFRFVMGRLNCFYPLSDLLFYCSEAPYIGHYY